MIAIDASGLKVQKRKLFRDARDFQILYLGIFLNYGIFFLQWNADVLKYLTIISTCITVQAIGIYFTSKDFRGLKSAMITALGLCLLMKANSLSTLMFASTVAIASKFLIRIGGKHLFNPANIGIIAAIMLTGDAWISPGQWGSGALLLYFSGAMALIVLLKVGRLDLSVVFLLTFAALEFLRSYFYLGWESEVVLHKLCNGSLLLFTFFMITDPKTTPNHPKARIIWAFCLGIFAFVLTNWFYVHSAPIWALFFFAPLTVLLDRYLKYRNFEW